MDYKKVFWGVLFILIGLLFVLKNLNILDFSWYQFLNLWPLLLVLWGIAMLPIKGVIKLILSLTMVAMGIYLVNTYDPGCRIKFHSPRFYWHGNRSEWRDSHRDHENNVKSDDTDWETQLLSIPYSAEISKATLQLDAAAGEFYLQKTSDELIEVRKEGNIGSYSLTSQKSHDSQVLNLSMEQATIRVNRLKHRVEIKLHEKPVWDLDMDIGAASVDMDLSPFKINRINIDGGASEIQMKLGSLYPEINVVVDAGVSSIVIEVPEDSGCRIKTSTVLSGKNIRGFKKTGSGRYETENFVDSENKILINIDVAGSKIEVRRY